MMHFEPSAEQQAMVEAAREFTREWIAPNAPKYDRYFYWAD